MNSPPVWARFADFLLNNWGNLASVGGLVFSILAFVFSRRASVAAKAATEAALRRSLGEQIEDSARSASELVTYLELRQDVVVMMKARDLRGETAYLLSRWAQHLSAESKNNLLTAMSLVESVHSVVSGKKAIAELNSKQLLDLRQTTARIAAIFASERGLAAKIEDEVLDGNSTG